mgnify:CR=1 FL=1
MQLISILLANFGFKLPTLYCRFFIVLAVLPGYSLYVATLGNIWEFRARPSSSQASFTKIPISRGLNINAVAYDPLEKRVYWSDVQTTKIYRAFLNGQGEHAIVE